MRYNQRKAELTPKGGEVMHESSTVAPQGSDAWKRARCGLITASRISDVLSFNQPSASVAKENGFKLVREAVAAGLKGARVRQNA